MSATATAEPEWDALITVGTVARAHGLAGQVVVAAQNDDAGDRFLPGASLRARVAGEPRVLVVERASAFQGRWLVKFEGVGDRTLAEELQGADLRVAAASLPELPDGAFYHHALIGCEVFTTTGARVGSVRRVEGGVGQSVLVVEDDGHEVLIPLAQALCPVIDPGHGRIVVDPPAGLLDLNR